MIRERHRHRYEFNNHYLQKLLNAGLRFPGFSRDGLVEIVELPSIRGFVACQFHPEFTLEPARRPPAVHGLHPRRPRARRGTDAGGRAAHEAAAVSRSGSDQPFFLIAGPCVIESEALALDIAGRLQDLTRGSAFRYIFKASFDKANRSSKGSFRGPGLEQGLRILGEVRRQTRRAGADRRARGHAAGRGGRGRGRAADAGVPVPPDQLHPGRGARGMPVNIKKGQFLSPWEMRNVVDKARSTGNEAILVCERGFSFGYNNLVADMRSLAVMRETGCPVVFDATHSVQLPGRAGPCLRRPA